MNQEKIKERETPAKLLPQLKEIEKQSEVIEDDIQDNYEEENIFEEEEIEDNYDFSDGKKAVQEVFKEVN